MASKISLVLAVVLFLILAQTLFGSPAISYAYPSVSVTTDSSTTIASNPLSFGVMMDHTWTSFVDSSVQQQLVESASIKLIRLFDFRETNPLLMPVKSWQESTKSGVYDWTAVDSLVQKIFSVGAEPLICLGYARSGDMVNYIPPGMTLNSVTKLPNPSSYAAYAKAWVTHFKNKGWAVRYYEIFNEPFAYFGYVPDTTKLAYFTTLWNTCAKAMREANPNVQLSFDFILKKQVFDYWLTHGETINYLDTHNYGVTDTSFVSDAEIFKLAEKVRTVDDYSFYSFSTAKQKWQETRGNTLKSIISETNLNIYENDTRIQKMTGAVRTALSLRTAILNGVDYHLYYEFSSSATFCQSHNYGYGLGMINSDNEKPWYPYYAQKLVGENLAVGDKILESTCSSSDVRVIAWMHKSAVNVLLIHKAETTATTILSGLSSNCQVAWIDNTFSFSNATVQFKIIDPREPLNLNGYTVMLLKFAA